MPRRIPALPFRSWSILAASGILLAGIVAFVTVPAFSAPPRGQGVSRARAHAASPPRLPVPSAPVPYAMVIAGFARLPQDSPLVLRGRPRPALRVLPFRAAPEWKRFWTAQGQPAPSLDFARFSALVCLGRPGAAEVRAVSLVRRTRQVTATLSSPRWPHLDLAPECRPFAVIRVERDALQRVALALREDVSSRTLAALVDRARRLPALPSGSLAALTTEKLEQWKAATRSAGQAWFAQADTLARTSPGAHRPYALLLQARVARQWLQDDGRPDAIAAGVEREFPRTPVARETESNRVPAATRALDAAAWPWLEARRLALAALPRSDPERGSLLLALGLSYEHTRTLRPLSLLLAERCYQESGTENGLFRAAEIHDLWFDRNEARRLYWQLVQMKPDSHGVITCLDRMAAIEDSLMLTGGTTRPFRAFLATWPRGPRAVAIRRWLGSRLPRTKAAPPSGKASRRAPAR